MGMRADIEGEDSVVGQDGADRIDCLVGREFLTCGAQQPVERSVNRDGLVRRGGARCARPPGRLLFHHQEPWNSNAPK